MFLISQTLTVRSSDPETTLSEPRNDAEFTRLETEVNQQSTVLDSQQLTLNVLGRHTRNGLLHGSPRVGKWNHERK